MSVFILVHGGSHGAWCWKKVVPLLEAQGHTVIAIDLPGHGDDPASPIEQTAETYTERILATLDMQTESVILVGHSMGGVSLSIVAEARPEKVAKLVYLTATLLPNGINTFALFDQYGMSLQEVSEMATPNSIKIKDEFVSQLFYNDCSAEDIAFAKARLCPEPLAIFTATVHTTPERFGKVRRFYVQTLQDQLVPPEVQRGMCTVSPCEAVFEIDSSHSPFFSQPEKLVKIFAEIAKR